MNDKEYIKLAIEQSRISIRHGNFPAGAAIVMNDKVVSVGTSDIFPGYQHAECMAIDKAFRDLGNLYGAALYASMEPCLMCLTRAYWAGIRRLVYAIKKENVDGSYYEGEDDNSEIVDRFNEPFEYIYERDLEAEALEVVSDWKGKSQA